MILARNRANIGKKMPIPDLKRSKSIGKIYQSFFEFSPIFKELFYNILKYKEIWG